MAQWLAKLQVGSFGWGSTPLTAKKSGEQNIAINCRKIDKMTRYRRNSWYFLTYIQCNSLIIDFILSLIELLKSMIM